MSTPRKKPGLAETLTGTDLFVYDGAGSQLIVLNQSALFIWSLCDGRHDAARMLELLGEIYPEVPRDALQADIENCLQSFAGKQLLEAAE